MASCLRSLASATGAPSTKVAKAHSMGDHESEISIVDGYWSTEELERGVWGEIGVSGTYRWPSKSAGQVLSNTVRQRRV